MIQLFKTFIYLYKGNKYHVFHIATQPLQQLTGNTEKFKIQEVWCDDQVDSQQMYQQQC